MPKTFASLYVVSHPILSSPLKYTQSANQFNRFLLNKSVSISSRMASSAPPPSSDENVDEILRKRDTDVRRMKHTSLRRQLTETWNKLADISLIKHYGPKGIPMETMTKRPDDIDIEDSDSNNHLAWRRHPKNVFVVKKPGDSEILQRFKEVVPYLINEKGFTVFVEEKVKSDPALETFDLLPQLCTYRYHQEDADFVICLGGDGTFLYATSLFCKPSPPPIMCFGLGSLGFLTHFDASNFKDDIDRITNKYMSITMRNRISASIIPSMIKCSISDDDDICTSEVDSPNAQFTKCSSGDIQPEIYPDDDTPKSPSKRKTRAYLSDSGEVVIEELGTPKIQNFTCINEVTVDRGVSPYLIQVEIYLNDFMITTAQADGIIIATPTGSTAYSLAAGASILHPGTEAFIITPICPHSLSFRPIVVPNGVTVKLKLAECSRHNAWISFDGRDRQEVKMDDSIVLKLDPNPIPCLNNTGHVSDWFKSLINGLNWNVRESQKKL